VFVHFPHDRRSLGWIELCESDREILFEQLTRTAPGALLGVTPSDEGDVDEAAGAFFGCKQHHYSA
jgi:hypothetical protein